MRHLVLSLALIVSTLVLPTFALRASVGRPATPAAQVQELPNIPIVTGGWQEKFWTHKDGTKFHYFEMVTGTPVILIHGSGGTALNWMMNGLGASLAKTNRVLAIDMRGHGQTVGPDGKRQRRTPNMDLDVLAFMDAMKIQRAHIGGFSMGYSRPSGKNVDGRGGAGLRWAWLLRPSVQCWPERARCSSPATIRPRR